MIRGVNSAARRQSNSRAREQDAVQSKPTTAIALPHKPSLRWFSWTAALAGIATASAGLGAALALLAPFHPLSQSGAKATGFGDLFKSGFQYGVSRPVNILVMGIDQGLDTANAQKTTQGPSDMLGSRSDTMLLVRLNPDIQKASVLTIPRDTQVNIPGIGVEKINAANWKGGPSLASDVVSKTLNDVPVDRYIRISTLAFIDLVNVVGGIEVFVPKVMKYDDQTQKLHIDLKPGLQTLNGEQAQGFVRFRHDDLGDIGRTQRQQMLLKALQKKFQNPLMLARLPEVFSVLQKHIDSNLSLGEMLALVQFGMQIKSNQFQMVMLPGRFSTPDEFALSYWLMDRTAMDRVMKTYFEVEPIADAILVSAPSAANLAGNNVAGDNAAELKIVVQNASGEPDGSKRMADFLAQAGFTNIAIDKDWPEALDQTQVVPQWGNLDAAQKLQQTLGGSEVTADSTGNLRSDITIRVGRSWTRDHQAAPVR